MTPDPELPPRWDWLFRKFCGYVRKMLRKHFHAVRLSRGSASIPNDGAPLLFVLNHPSWWDPLVCVALLDLIPNYTNFAAIDAVAVQKYRILTKLGYFPVDPHTLRGAAQFLRTCKVILNQPRRSVWVTAQGEFADVRTRPLNLKNGVGHLASKLGTGYVIPVALEYAFWNERTPEALVRIGEAIPFGSGSSGKDWTERIEANLTAALDALNREAMGRDPAAFRTLIGGTTGAGGMYDLFRRFGFWMRGRKFEPAHSTTASEVRP
jgi:1-acyl-sn-glycerol-3-phosphate acyltransferase